MFVFSRLLSDRPNKTTFSFRPNIDTQNQLLFRDSQAITLEPKVYELLIFFCQNSERLISKDELMAKVWAGSIVNDNTISRTLVKVRKALNDEPKSPVFIITIPRKGYQMLAQFRQFEQLNLIDDSNNINNAAVVTRKFFKTTSDKVTSIFYFFVLVGTILLSLNIINEPTLSILQNKQIMALTRATGIEWYPAMSPDMAQLAYSQVDSLSNLKQITIL